MLLIKKKKNVIDFFNSSNNIFSEIRNENQVDNTKKNEVNDEEKSKDGEEPIEVQVKDISLNKSDTCLNKSETNNNNKLNDNENKVNDINQIDDRDQNLQLIKKTTKSNNSINIKDFDTNNQTDSRIKILNKYLSIVDNVLINQDENSDDDNYFCSKCHQEKFVLPNEAILICKNCGEMNYILLDSDKPSYKDPPKEISYFAYKRINHFNEWLAQFQAKESTDIPELVYDQILMEIKKERIENMANLKAQKLRVLLKKLKLNKYYEHVPHIMNRLNGIPAPVMTRETEELLRSMFREIQNPFMKYCPKDRKNFLSYSYVLHKFVQLLNMDEFLVCFPLLKSREKLHQQDIIWKQICDDLNWEFIKSL